MFMYVTLTVVILSLVGLWTPYQLKNTIFWTLSVAFVMLFKTEDYKQSPHLLKILISDNFKILVIIQFITSFYTFSLLIEFFILPFSLLLAMLVFISSLKYEFSCIQKTLHYIIALIGIYLLLDTLFKLISRWDDFIQINTAYDFFIPPLLTLLYIPFIVILTTVFAYERAFILMNRFIVDTSIRNFAKRYSLIRFNLRWKLLDRWLKLLLTINMTSKEEIKDSVNLVFKMRRNEQENRTIEKEYGWSPYEAKSYLLNEGLKTDYYHPDSSGIWWAQSNFKTIDESNMNTILYSVEGTESIVKNLKLELNVYLSHHYSHSLSKFISYAKKLHKKALNQEMPYNIEKSILKGEDKIYDIDCFRIEFKKIRRNHKDYASYDMVYVLSIR